METKTVRKVFAEWSFDKEEEWLNSMAQEGWTLKKVGFCKYVFERTEPGEYIIRLAMHDADEEYMELMRESGAECVGRVLQWLYFRKKAELGEFELFSDIDSRIAHQHISIPFRNGFVNPFILLFFLISVINSSSSSTCR